MPDMLTEKVCLKSALRGLRPPSENVIPIRPLSPEVTEARLNVIRSAVQLCELECGGCDLSRMWRETGAIR